MADTATDFTTELQTRILEAVRIGQDAIVDGVRTAAGVLGDVLPEMPAIPFTDGLPTPNQAVDATFNIVQMAVAQQKVFADRLIEAAAPLLPSAKA
ncbi:MAG: hypothetical protein ACR2H3_14885 [Acidimicrobiales bacterium]